MKRLRRVLPICLPLALGAPCRAWALTPRQIVVIVNTHSIGSQEVARGYMQARHIRASHIIGLPLPMVDTIPASYYAARIERPIRRILQRRGLKKQVRCIVTTFGVPLRVAAAAPSAADQREAATLRQMRSNCIRRIDGIIAALHALGRTGPAAAPGKTAPAAPPVAPGAKAPAPNIAMVAMRLSRAVQSARVRLAKVVAHNPRLEGQFLQLVQQAAGPHGVLQVVHVIPGSPHHAAAVAALAAMRRQIAANAKRYAALMPQRGRRAVRVQMRILQLQSFGQMGLLNQAQQDLFFILRQGVSTAVDSRLMGLWTLPATSRRVMVPNPMYLPLYGHLPQAKNAPRTLMTARLDGLSPGNVIRMIDTSLRVEKKGLHGVAYFDARGLHAHDAYSMYDSDIRHAARFIQRHSTMHVVLDDTPALLQAKNCPRAALYCGWYSLRHYVDTVQWLPGCVGYHVASFELVTLHDPHETGWVMNMLNRGVCGTLGAVDEPYLTAFPPPRLFFPLLLSGKYTQAEVYAMTCPQVNWRIAYVGDPLYNPFHRDPRITLATLRADPLLKIALKEMPLK